MAISSRRRRTLGVLGVAVAVGVFILYVSSYNNATEVVQHTSGTRVIVYSPPAINVIRNGSQLDESVYYDPVYHSRMLQASQASAASPACRIPQLNPWDKSLMPYFTELLEFRDKPSLVCLENEKLPQLTYVWKRTHIRINESVVGLFKDGRVTENCTVVLVNKNGVRRNVFGKIYNLTIGEGFKIPELEQFILVRCGKYLGPKESEETEKPEWQYVHFHVRLVEPPEIKEKIARMENSPKRLSVLYLMQDSVSHLMARRVLNKTYYYLLNERNAVALHGYNSIGYNTFPNLIPWLTGHHVEELESYEDNYFNELNWPFSWKNFSANNYATAYLEDRWRLGLFNYGKWGFSVKPTDYYFETFFQLTQEMESCASTGYPNYFNHQRMWDEIFALPTLKNYLILSIVNSLSHEEIEPLAQGDEEYYKFFKRHFDLGTFNNTLVIVGSDHGFRFGGIRKTPLGRTEERLPLQLLIFPEWFKKQYKDQFNMLQENAKHALTSPFDMHYTLVNDIMTAMNPPETKPEGLQRGMSLFRKIPLTRTCSDAGVPSDYCVCRNMTSLPLNSTEVISATKAAVQHLNTVIEPYAAICERWTSALVIAAQVATGTKTMLQLKETFSDYVVIFEASPAGATFEATVRKYNGTKDFVIEGNIIRTSLYGRTADCIESNALMRNYCFCKNQKRSWI